MAKINITIVAGVTSIALIASFASCASTIPSIQSGSFFRVPTETPRIHTPINFESKVSEPGEGGHRGAYKIGPNGDKIQIGEWVYWYPNGKIQLRAFY